MDLFEDWLEQQTSFSRQQIDFWREAGDQVLYLEAVITADTFEECLTAYRQLRRT